MTGPQGTQEEVRGGGCYWHTVGGGRGQRTERPHAHSDPALRVGRARGASLLREQQWPVREGNQETAKVLGKGRPQAPARGRPSGAGHLWDGQQKPIEACPGTAVPQRHRLPPSQAVG